MVVKKPVVKKRKSKKGKTTKNITKTGKGGNVSQVVNVYVSKTTRQRKAKPVRIQPQIQPQMYTAGQDNLLLGLQQQNKTLMDILNRQRIADTTPNTDIFTLDDIAGMKNKKPTPSSSGESTYDTIFDDDEGFTMKEKTKRSVSTTKPKASENIVIDTPSRPNVVIDTTSRQNVSNMLSSIAEGMSEIPQTERIQSIQSRIFEIGDQLRPQGIRVRIAEIDELDEKNRLENDFYTLRTQLQDQKRFDDTIKMTEYRTIPKKVNTLRLKVAQMRNKLNQSRRLTADEV